MPTATPFTALGAGNGFPACLTKVDISILPTNYKWTTLSGVNADNYNSFSESALVEKVNSSLVMAMNIYYNLYKTSGLSASTSGYISFRNSRFQPSEGIKYIWNSSVSGMTDDDAASVKEPFERVCGYSRNLTKSEINVATYVHNNNTFNFGSVSIDDTLSTTFAFYDENKLLGYASAEGATYLYNSSVLLNNTAHCYIAIRSLVNPEPNVSEDFEKRITDYGTVDGMHFVIIKYGKIHELFSPESGDGYSGIVNAPSILLNENGVQLSYVYKWDYDPDDDPDCTPQSRFCFPKFADHNWTCSVSGPTSLTYYDYN